jgi:hypothetical protein
MATTALDKAGCGCTNAESLGDGCGDGLLPAMPFTALQYHFGMLLGVDDLETAQAYPRGKIRLHNAWLHGEGVVWGLDVEFNKSRELLVTPGLALDAAGHELHLDAPVCVDLGKWYDKHKDDTDFKFADDGAGGRSFDAHVVARFRACFARPVPAIADPCAGSDVDTAFSRVSETVELLIRPGKSDDKTRPYHRLRILFALEKDSAQYDDVKQRRQTIQALPLDQQPAEYLRAFREFAALDEIDRLPQLDGDKQPSSLFPDDPTEVVLADLVRVDVRPGQSSSILADPLPTIDVRVRPSHVATSTIQELLCGPLFGAIAAAPQAPLATDDAGGPRADPKSVKLTTARRITLATTKPVDPASADAEQFDVTTYASDHGWSALEISNVATDAAGTTITIDLKKAMPADQIVRLVARGTGPQPILGTDLVPFAGIVGGPPGSVNDGHDFAIILRRS